MNDDGHEAAQGRHGQQLNHAPHLLSLDKGLVMDEPAGFQPVREVRTPHHKPAGLFGLSGTALPVLERFRERVRATVRCAREAKSGALKQVERIVFPAQIGAQVGGAPEGKGELVERFPSLPGVLPVRRAHEGVAPAKHLIEPVGEAIELVRGGGEEEQSDLLQRRMLLEGTSNCRWLETSIATFVVATRLEGPLRLRADWCRSSHGRTLRD
ncbi:MAG: hypothetical protein C5B53_01980 [Candidatus Melainabacteria bacterium]|nr:MAG: hypothetical protein C5B53_01980 [Candidatus Melainabacteria bacterium]